MRISTARDMAKFGLLYLNDGEYDGNQITPVDWVHESLQTYSEDAWDYRVGRNFRDIGYGYQWWSAAVSPFSAAISAKLQR
jgi:CubicO group peptidase (beta-lactamase class C family)